jgi:hypothetical protein
MRTGRGSRILRLIKKVLIIGAGDAYSVLSRKSGLFCFYKTVDLGCSLHIPRHDEY